MPYSFVEIEKQKSWIIRAVFIFLVILYFLVAEIIWLITKLYFISESKAVRILAIFSLPEALIVFFIAFVIAFTHWRFSTKDMVARILDLLRAVEPDPKDSYHQVLKNVVEEVCVATGGKRIDCRVIPSSSLNAFAISDFRENAVIGVTEGLLGKLNRSQLEAVIGHEAAHVASGDSLLTTVTTSLFGVYSALLEGVKRALGRVSQGRRAGGVVFYLVILYIILSFTKITNLLLNMFLSRQKEYRADAVSIRLTRNPISLAEALYIISRGWRGVSEVSDSLSSIFITSPDYNDLEESEGFIADMFSTHPPTKNRLAILLDMAHYDMSMLKGSMKLKQKIPVEAGVSDEILRQVLQDRLAGKVIAGGNVCPQCIEPLSEILYEGAPVLKCSYCEGIFASRNVISRIMTRKDFSFSPLIEKVAEVALKTYTEDVRRNHLRVAYELICPKCKDKMWRGIYSYGYPIEVDKCEKCQYIWFNKDELETLQYLFEKFRTEGI